jgi:hypothetical protein
MTPELRTELAHTVDEALGKFTLIAGSGDGKTTACAMTALSWIKGYAWSEAMPCAHRTIRGWVIRANDASSTTIAQREELIRAGELGVIDTWWIPTVVVAWAFRIEKGNEPADFYVRVLLALKRIGEWKPSRALPYLSGAYLSGADLSGANLSGANLSGANLSGANLSGCVLPAGWKRHDTLGAVKA